VDATRPVRFIARQYNYFATRAETPRGFARWEGVGGERSRSGVRRIAMGCGELLPSSLFAKQSAIRIGLAENKQSDN